MLPAPLQGPPGTGKTRTILNLLSVVMHAAAKGSLELLQAGAMGSSREVGSRRAAAATCQLLVLCVLWGLCSEGSAAGPAAAALP